MDDKTFMAKVMDGAKFSLENDRSPAFAMIVNRYGDIVSQSPNLAISENDPTAHAEILVIREASKKIKSLNLEGLTLYTSIEPCLMCLSACYWAKIKRVVYALGKDRLEVHDYEGSFNNKELIPKLNFYIELKHELLFEERMLDLIGIWEDRLKKYWKPK